MSLLKAWNEAEKEVEGEVRKLLAQKIKPPKEVLELLKTKTLKEHLAEADKAQADENVEDARTAASKVQKHLTMYGTKFKAASLATKAKPKPRTDEKAKDEFDPDEVKAMKPFEPLHDTLIMVMNVAITRAQNGARKIHDDVMAKAQAAAKTDERKQQLDIKKALLSLRFKQDWLAAKADFEAATGKSKPSEKIMGVFRKSAGLDNALNDLDKACKKASPDDYRAAYKSFQTQSASYAKVLDSAIAKDKSADPTYKKKADGLKEMLTSLDTRAYEKIRLLNDLGV